MPLIQPRTLKGFRDFLPATMNAREALIQTAREVYRSFGFSPIDTPALELAEILLGKGGDETDKQMFRFVDHGKRDVALRFDLTIPLARYAAQHIGELGTPFKRYHIATVWRGENTQRGRYREFMQCDFDTIGSQSVNSDIETVLVIHELMTRIGFQSFTIHVNNRRVLNGLLEQESLSEQAVPILRTLDKLGKIGRDGVQKELVEQVQLTPEAATRVLDLSTLSETVTDPAALLTQLEQLLGENEIGQQGVSDLRRLYDAVQAVGIPAGRVKIDLSIARGLDYYTGTIFETFLGDLPGIGSVCSGGRYDNLAELYTKQALPGVGASLGLDRLLAAMEELNLVENVTASAPVFVPFFDKNRFHDYLALAQELRQAGIGVEVYPEPKKLGAQLKYADRRGFKLALIAGEDEFNANQVQLKSLADGNTEQIARDNLADRVASLLV